MKPAPLSLPRPVRARRVATWIVALAALAAVASLALPRIEQPPAYHAFADQRTILGVVRGADVLSNLAFLAVALVAIARLSDRGRARLTRGAEASLWTIAVALALTSVGSAYYHADPRDATLVWDRVPLALTLAGVFGVAIAQRLGSSPALLALPLLGVLAIASVVYWRASGNLMPYGVFQYGGGLAVVLLLATTQRGDDRTPWLVAVGAYAIAKAFEVADAVVFDATGGLLAGHAMKHAFAAAAAAAVLWPAIRARR
jgi:hypothetical protein